MKRRKITAILAAAFVVNAGFTGITANAAQTEEIQTQDNGFGGYHEYDYELKELYDQQFDCIWIEGDATFADLVALQSAPTLDLEKFINSAYGEKTAENFYTYITYDQDPMNEELVAYWEEKGLTKEYYPDESGEEEGIGDYYVYSPNGSKGNFDTSYPCILVIHGGGEPAYQAETFGYCQIAAEEGIILIMAENQDVEALSTIFETVAEEYPIDRSRVYASGSSAGGRASKLLAATYPTMLAAVAPLDNAPVYNGTEEQLEESEKYGLAVISIGGLQDKYYRFNLQQGVDETYDRHAEILDGTDGWNRMLRACGIEGYELTPEQVRENRDYSTELIPALTGYEYENTTIDHRTNSRTYVSTITNTDGIVTLCQVLTENHGHMPSGYDAEYAWNFMKHFSRDLDTGMLIYTE